jgi:hypothetical protein
MRRWRELGRGSPGQLLISGNRFTFSRRIVSDGESLEVILLIGVWWTNDNARDTISSTNRAI